MAKQTIDPGTAPTGAGGDTFRSGSAKLQANDNELYTHLGADDGSLTAAKTRTALGLGTAATATLTNSSTDATIGRVLKVGDFGIGGLVTINTPEAQSLRSGFYNAGASATEFGVYSSFINSEYSSGLGFQIGVGPYTTGLAGRNLRFRIKDAGNTWSPVYNLYSSKNTAVDANGFIKAASPIVQLFADGIELNDEAKQQEIVFEKLGTGDYLIKGSSGFAQEGWYVETPKDANGNVLFSVIYAALENGDISVKTYKKKFDFETVSIVADLDNPVDITEGRWIDLRLQELPQPEIEMPESIAPPEFQPTGLTEAVAKVMESYHDPEQ